MLGGSAVMHFGPADLAANTEAGEALPNTARLLSRLADVLVARPAAHAELIDVAEHAGVPVINAGTDCNAPVQVTAFDLLYICVHFQ